MCSSDLGTYVFDYGSHEQLYKDLRAMFDPKAHADAVAAQAAAQNQVAVMADTPPPQVEAKVLASSKKTRAAKKAA